MPILQIPIPQIRFGKSIQDNAFFDSIIRAINNLATFPIPGPYANDAAAKAAKIAIGSAYYQPSGAVVVRLV